MAHFSPLPGSEAAPSLCQPCRLAPPAFVQAVAYGGYHGQLRELIYLLKYEGMQPIAERLGGLLVESMRPFAPLLEETTIIPVPMHAAKQRARGFNHAERLAQAAMRELRRRHPQWKLQMDSSLLKRVRITVSQAGLTSHQRRKNLRGAFFVPDATRVRGRHILLIDDIYTTGATARACSRVLKNAGAASVRVATVARAQREGVAAWDPGFLRTMFVR